MNRILYFRADGNKEIGTGHIMRCISIATAASNLGVKCAFIAADYEMQAIIESRGYEFICLKSAWNNMEIELSLFSEIIASRNIKKLIIDSYFVTEKYLAHLCQLTEVTYIDDLNAFHYPCHRLINYNYYARKFNYPEHYPGIPVLLGCSYAPLRDEFKQIPLADVFANFSSVLITTGGSDPLNIAGKILTKIYDTQDFEGIIFHVVVGRFNPFSLLLEELAKKCPNFVIHKNVTKISELMSSCNAAISAAGSTLYELCACGIPTVTFTMADNQLDGAKSFEADIMAYAGDVRDNEDVCLNVILTQLHLLEANPQLRAEKSAAMQHLVDGNGAERIVKNFFTLEMNVKMKNCCK